MTKLRHEFTLLERDGDTSLDAANHLAEALSELWLLLLDDLTLLVLLVGDEDLFDVGLLGNCVNVQDALVTLGHNGLVVDQLHNVDFSFE